MIRSTCLEREIQRFQKNDDPQNWYTTTRVERVHSDTTVRLMCCSFHRALSENGNYYIFNIFFCQHDKQEPICIFGCRQRARRHHQDSIERKIGDPLLLLRALAVTHACPPAKFFGESCTYVRSKYCIRYDSTVQCEGCATYL